MKMKTTSQISLRLFCNQTVTSSSRIKSRKWADRCVHTVALSTFQNCSLRPWQGWNKTYCIVQSNCWQQNTSQVKFWIDILRERNWVMFMVDAFVGHIEEDYKICGLLQNFSLINWLTKLSSSGLKRTRADVKIQNPPTYPPTTRTFSKL